MPTLSGFLIVDAAWGAPTIWFRQVPDVKHGKNRLHLDLRTADLTGEVNRLLALGATLLTGQPVDEDGSRWHILADPDGNEFCVLQPPDPSPEP